MAFELAILEAVSSHYAWHYSVYAGHSMLYDLACPEVLE